jgi:hypothetical protein
MHEYGIHDLEALAAVLQGRSEKAMREAIAALPDGVYTSEVWNNPLGTPLRYPVKLTVKGDTIEVDFEGAPPQLPQGGPQLHAQLQRLARDLSAQMHADAERARQCRLTIALSR